MARPDKTEDAAKRQRLIVGISGASGLIYARTMLMALRSLAVESHLVVSRAARQTLAMETDWSLEELLSLADVVHPIRNVGASIASGSFPTMGMVVIPCSIRTLSEIVHGTTTSLLTRAADVVLKERRRLVLVVRETPFHAGHLKTMLAATEMGAIIAPPIPAMYARPQSVQDLVNHSVGRILDLLGIDNDLAHRWHGLELGPKVTPGHSAPENRHG